MEESLRLYARKYPLFHDTDDINDKRRNNRKSQMLLLLQETIYDKWWHYLVKTVSKYNNVNSSEKIDNELYQIYCDICDTSNYNYPKAICRKDQSQEKNISRLNVLIHESRNKNLSINRRPLFECVQQIISTITNDFPIQSLINEISNELYRIIDDSNDINGDSINDDDNNNVKILWKIMDYMNDTVFYLSSSLQYRIQEIIKEYHPSNNERENQRDDIDRTDETTTIISPSMKYQPYPQNKLVSFDLSSNSNNTNNSIREKFDPFEGSSTQLNLEYPILSSGISKIEPSNIINQNNNNIASVPRPDINPTEILTSTKSAESILTTNYLLKSNPSPMPTVISSPMPTVISSPMPTVISPSISTVISSPMPTVISSPMPTVISPSISIDQYIESTVSKPITSDVPEPITYAVPEPVTYAVPEPITYAVPEPVTYVVPEPITTVVPEPIASEIPEPITSLVPEPITSLVPELITSVVPEPIASEIPEPITSLVPEPITSLVPEQISSLVPEPIVSGSDLLMESFDTNDIYISDDQTSYDNSPMNDKTLVEYQLINNSVNNALVNNALVNNALVNNALANNAPVNNAPVNNEPINNEPINNEPIINEPIINEPANNEPINNEPINNEPANNEPVNNESANNEPANNAPDNNAPDNNAPDNNAPDNNAPDNNAPDNNAPDNNAPDNNAPDNNAPDNNAPDNNVPDNNAPVISGYSYSSSIPSYSSMYQPSSNSSIVSSLSSTKSVTYQPSSMGYPSNKPPIFPKVSEPSVMPKSNNLSSGYQITRTNKNNNGNNKSSGPLTPIYTQAYKPPSSIYTPTYRK
jgi:hypothetical protein